MKYLKTSWTIVSRTGSHLKRRQEAKSRSLKSNPGVKNSCLSNIGDQVIDSVSSVKLVGGEIVKAFCFIVSLCE